MSGVRVMQGMCTHGLCGWNPGHMNDWVIHVHNPAGILPTPPAHGLLLALRKTDYVTLARDLHVHELTV